MNTPQIISPLRQVQFIQATLSIVGILLGMSFSPWFLFLDIFVGFSLLIASLSGSCWLLKMFSAFPWNKPLK